MCHCGLTGTVAACMCIAVRVPGPKEEVGYVLITDTELYDLPHSSRHGHKVSTAFTSRSLLHGCSVRLSCVCNIQRE